MDKRKRVKKAYISATNGSGVILLVLALPLFIINLFVKLFFLFIDLPKYKRSFSRLDDGIAYSHSFYRSDSFALNEKLHEERSSIKIVQDEDDDSFYFEGNEANYFFLEFNDWFFEVKDGSLYISDDGLEFQEARLFLSDKGPQNGKDSILLLFKEEAVNLNYEEVDLSPFKEVIIDDSIEGFARKLIENEACI
ncbi:MAG: hypothetical protein J6328_00610 [Bacilli bacterium]|nr:hypothetical protein [Bacilli bacterium]